MMNWKQQAAASIVTPPMPQAHQMSQPGPSAQELREAAERFAAQQAERPWSTFLEGKADTCRDIASKLDRYGTYASPKQAEFAHKLVGWSYPREAPVAAPQPVPAAITPYHATPVQATPEPWLSMPSLCGLVNLDKFAKLTVHDISLHLKNDGSLIWVKYKGVVVGMIDAALRSFRWKRHLHLSASQKDLVQKLLVDIEADPLAAVRGHGILTGRCACCGRPLTDPNSIEFGIGPVCRARGWSLA